MEHLEIDRDFQIQTNQEDSYYHEYCRLYLANVVLTTQVKELIEEKNNILKKLSQLENEDFNSSYDKNIQKDKRFRRTAPQIQRFYLCCVKECERSYGSQGSLNQHYRLKHPEIYVTLPNVQSLCLKSYDQQSQSQLLQKPKEQKKKVKID